MNLDTNIQSIESAIHRFEIGSLPITKARRIIRAALLDMAKLELDTKLTLHDTIKAIAEKANYTANRKLGATLIRLISCDGVISTDSVDGARRYIIKIIEDSYSNLVSNHVKTKRARSHEKIEAARLVHEEACGRLQCLSQPFSTLEELVGRRQLIMRELSQGPTRQFLNSFQFEQLRTTVNDLLNMANVLVDSQGHKLQTRMQNFLESVQDDILQFANADVFTVREFLIPFLERTKSAATEMHAAMADRFECSITVPSNRVEIDKKYPLHRVGSTIRVVIMLSVEGPGIAQDISITALTDHCKIQSDFIQLGDIVPGPFPLTLLVDITEPQRQLEFDVEVEWGVIGDPKRRTEEFSILVEGQRTDLDWKNLESKVPYSLEVAREGDFFGRQDAVERILRRLAPDSMQSCYITGQKRVGKSSLAKAIENEVRSRNSSGDYFVSYLECGEIRHTSGQETLQEIGIQLEEFLKYGLPHPIDWNDGSYESSLTPLSRLAQKLLRERPEARFVIILDEFDEINEDLYRYGDLADTFFLNLRTLSTKRNLAFVLVGAERMPYVMSSQGDRLNKFAMESLDSFNLENEWEDFCAMVETPVQSSIKFLEQALRSLYDLTNGHPYFTKFLCSKVFERAVQSQDAEVSIAEISRAADVAVSTLDNNAFMHYWRDGIQGGAEETAIISLKRCRVLMAWARAARSSASTILESVESNLHANGITKGEVLPFLEDFCRRGVFFIDKNGCYAPTVKLFSEWLIEGGFSQLISDQLGDELAQVKQRREDEAFVSVKEITQVASKWDLYQGREITSQSISEWLGQVESNIHRRLLFKALQNVRFVRDPEIREKFSHAHSRIRRKLPAFVKHARAQRRDDIFVSYLDGPGKSGAFYANLYASENEIVSKNVIDPNSVLSAIAETDVNRAIGIVIVDDFIGTGRTMVSNLSRRADEFAQVGIGTRIPLVVVVICGTATGERNVRKKLEDWLEADLEICELLDNKNFAFPANQGIWDSEEEKSEARILFRGLGGQIQKSRPLGYDNQGLLLTFSRNCPNNSLPILHGFGKADSRWNPLFPRTKT